MRPDRQLCLYRPLARVPVRSAQNIHSGSSCQRVARIRRRVRSALRVCKGRKVNERGVRYAGPRSMPTTGKSGPPA